MHSIPHIVLGNVTDRSVVRVFFPQMYQRDELKDILKRDLESIYNDCLHPLILYLMPDEGSLWPPDYNTAQRMGRNPPRHLRLPSFDIPPHLLDEFACLYLQRVQSLRPYFRHAYFGHELRAWKGIAVPNVDGKGEEDGKGRSAYERAHTLEDLTRVLDLELVNQDDWGIDVGLAFGIPGKVVTWKTQGHEALIRFLVPGLQNIPDILHGDKHYVVNHEMHLKDISGFCWTPHGHSNVFYYIQTYTTSKDVSNELYESHRSPLELLTDHLSQKLKRDVRERRKFLLAFITDNKVAPVHKDCYARLKVRVPLAQVPQVLTHFPLELVNQTMVQISSVNWWLVSRTFHLEYKSYLSTLQDFKVYASGCCISDHISFR